MSMVIGYSYIEKIFIYIPIKKLNQTAKWVQSYHTISQVVQTVRCKAYLLNPDKYFSKLLTGYIPLTIVHQISFSNNAQPVPCNNLTTFDGL